MTAHFALPWKYNFLIFSFQQIEVLLSASEMNRPGVKYKWQLWVQILYSDTNTKFIYIFPMAPIDNTDYNIDYK